MFKIFYSFLFLFLVASLHLFGQSRQTASVNIRVKLIKSTAVAVEPITTNSNDSDNNKSNMSENNKSEERAVIINYNSLNSSEKSKSNSINEKEIEFPNINLRNENSSDYSILTCNSNSLSKRITSKQKLLFEYPQVISNTIPSVSLAITVVY